MIVLASPRFTRIDRHESNAVVMYQKLFNDSFGVLCSVYSHSGKMREAKDSRVPLKTAPEALAFTRRKKNEVRKS